MTVNGDNYCIQFRQSTSHFAALPAFIRPDSINLGASFAWKLVGNLSASITEPGGGEMRLHAEQIFLSEPWPARPQG